MTSNKVFHVTRVRHISDERAAAGTLAEGPERDAALLHVDVLEHVRDCQRLAASGKSAVCNQIDVMADGVVNKRRPYLTWQCCNSHRELKTRREALTRRAAELGVEISLDMTQVIED